MTAAQISLECACEIAELCEDRYKTLLASGCADDVAADRIWDALNCAIDKTDMHCYDPRDSLFEEKLRQVARKDGAFI